MARKASKVLTDGELRIMKVVWKLKQASVKDVVNHLNKKENLAYNTVQTMMNILIYLTILKVIKLCSKIILGGHCNDIVLFTIKEIAYSEIIFKGIFFRPSAL